MEEEEEEEEETNVASERIPKEVRGQVVATLEEEESAQAVVQSGEGRRGGQEGDRWAAAATPAESSD